MKIFHIKREPMAALQLIPDRTIRNYNAESIGKAMAEFYTRPIGRFSFNKKVEYQEPDRFIFRIILTTENITFYLIVPERLVDYFKQKVQSVWEKATVKQVENLLELDLEKFRACMLVYRRHDMFSLNTNKDENAPLPSICSVITEMAPGDMALVDILFLPSDRVDWEYSTGKAYEKFQQGMMPRRLDLSLGTLALLGFEGLNSGMTALQHSIVTAIGGKIKQTIKPINPEREMLALKGLTTATTTKLHSPALKTFIRIAVQADNKQRAELVMRALAGAYKDITGDNELIKKNRNSKRVAIEIMNHRSPKVGGIYCSPGEVGKLIQLPTASLQDEYPIECIRHREVSVPEELTFDVPGVIIGEVTERGITKTVKFPVVKIPGVKLKHVYDALCTPTMGTGQVGTGKTEGFGGNWAMGFLLNGFTVFLIDTADGQQAKNLEDALPDDYPDEKIIHLEFDNKHWPIALNWGDVASRKLISAEGDDLEALEMAERLTSRLIDYIDGTAHAELTERMRQYLTSAARAVLRDPQKSLLDVELALRSPAYREELLADPAIQEQPEIVQDLMALQRKAENGTDASVIDPIISRLKMFSESRALQNLFLQPNKLDDKGRPLLDFRRFADNPEGSYGYLIAIHASNDAWGEDGQELVLSFIQDKILMAIYSRVDIPQDRRRPCLNLVDEPHRFINKAWRLYKNASVELRKYRMKLLWLAHYMSQMGPAAQAVASGGCQFTQYKTQDLKQFKELAHAFEPFDAEELYRTLPEKWVAVNKIRLPSGKDCPAFIAKMAPPPAFVRSREERRKECARLFGRHWKEVSKWIQEKRLKYQFLDETWKARK